MGTGAHLGHVLGQPELPRALPAGIHSRGIHVWQPSCGVQEAVNPHADVEAHHGGRVPADMIRASCGALHRGQGARQSADQVTFRYLHPFPHLSRT